jgi:hypothetical protein
VHVLGGVERLHGGHDPELHEPREVLGGEHLGVLQGEPGVPPVGAGGFQGPLEGVDGHVIGAVADAVHPQVEPHGEEFGGQLGQLVLTSDGLATIPRIVAVLLQEDGAP